MKEPDKPRPPIPFLGKLSYTRERLLEFRSLLDDLIDIVEYVQEVYPATVTEGMQIVSISEMVTLITGLRTDRAIKRLRRFFVEQDAKAISLPPSEFRTQISYVEQLDKNEPFMMRGDCLEMREDYSRWWQTQPEFIHSSRRRSKKS